MNNQMPLLLLDSLCDYAGAVCKKVFDRDRIKDGEEFQLAEEFLDTPTYGEIVITGPSMGFEPRGFFGAGAKIIAKYGVRLFELRDIILNTGGVEFTQDKNLQREMREIDREIIQTLGLHLGNALERNGVEGEMLKFYRFDIKRGRREKYF